MAASINAISHTDPIVTLSSSLENLAIRLAVATIVARWKYGERED